MADLYGMIQKIVKQTVEHNKIKIVIGKVIKSVPIQVEIESRLILDGDDLLIPDHIKNLKEDDRLIVMREEMQYIVIGRDNDGITA